ncbi:MAG: hypothetical protein C0592_03470 [Marinilabiliales bacterium]|nr:MAG: hypothetical protein C0592_03470 [Marinilabiliales bacterium]
MSSVSSEATAKLKIHKYVLPDPGSAYSTVSYVAADEVKAIPLNRSFSAPVKKYDPEFARVEVIADADVELVLPGSYQVSIEKGDLVDKDGNAVTGSYSVYFRDLSTPAEMALSGVPMKYDSGGVANQFQSAGMFEIYAMQGDKQLFVKEGEELDITMPTTDSDAGYNLYTYNETERNWEYQEALNKPVERPKPDSVPIYSDAYQLYYLSRLNYDENTFQQRWESEEYARTYKLKQDYTYNTRFYSRGNQMFTSFKVKRRYIKKYKHNVYFQLPVLSKSQSRGFFYRTYPELRYFRNVLWKYQGPLDKSGFYQTYCKRRRYYDMRIEYDSYSGYFTIKLKDKYGFEEFQAYPYRGKADLTAKDKKSNENLYNRYFKSLTRLARKFDKKIAFANRELNNSNNKKIREKMSSEELAMTWEEWGEYAQRAMNYKNAIMRYNSEVSLSRNISIKGFGLVNCDRIYRMQNPTQILASFFLPDGKSSKNGKVVLIDGADNSCLTQDMEGGRVVLTVEAASVNAIAFISDDEKMYLVCASEVATAVQSKGLNVFYPVVIDSDNASDAIYQALQL